MIDGKREGMKLLAPEGEVGALVEEARAQMSGTAKGPWSWSRTYEMEDGVRHWCIHNPEGDAKGRTIDACLVLLWDEDKWLGTPLPEIANARFIAWSREGVERLVVALEASEMLAASRPAPEGEVGALLKRIETAIIWMENDGYADTVRVLRDAAAALEASERANEVRCSQCAVQLGDSWCANCAGSADRERAERLEQERDTLWRGFEVLYNRLPDKEAVRAALSLIGERQ